MTNTDLLTSFAAIVGADAVLTGADAAPHYKDWRGRYAGNALAVVLPSDTQQVAELVKLCAAQRIAIVPQAGNTSLCGASVPLAGDGAQIVLNLSRMDRIREIDAVNYTMTVEAGCILADACTAAQQSNRLLPLSLPSMLHCEIGGNLSTNAGGINVLRYGTARDLVLGLEVVLPDGRIWNGLRALRKDNTGYSLRNLFIGAEGTLGIITAAVLKLSPRPQSSATACVAIANPDVGVRLLAHLRAVLGDTLSSFELFSRACLDLVLAHIPGTQDPFAQRHAWYLLIQAEDVLQTPLEAELRGALENFGDGIGEFGTAPDAARDWWVLRESIAEAQKREGISIKHDVAVPVSRVADFIAGADAALQRRFPDARAVTFGHMGDGNVHYNVSHRDAAQNEDFIAHHEGDVNEVVYEVIRSLDGTISAEHGIGQLKRAILPDYKDGVELELMRGIKQLIDPQGLMNPGKML